MGWPLPYFDYYGEPEDEPQDEIDAAHTEPPNFDTDDIFDFWDSEAL